MRLVTVEEHYMSKRVNEEVKKELLKDPNTNENMFKFVDNFVNNSLITNLGDERIAYMDEHGIDTQVVGYGNNAPSDLTGEQAVRLCREANDELFEATQKYPGRFYGYACLPLNDVEASIKELDRCVYELGFKGVLVNGTVNGHFLDEDRFFPLLEEIDRLGVVLYLHPDEVPNSVQDAYYKGNWKNPAVSRNFAGYAVGWHYEVGVHVMHLILAGVFDRLPNLKVICGHWGEMMPYYLDRMDLGLPQQMTGLEHPVDWYWKHNVWTDPSGMYFKDDMDFCLKVMGPDRILWAQDFCYLNGSFEHIDEVRSFLEGYGLSQEDLEKIAHENAEKLLNI